MRIGIEAERANTPVKTGVEHYAKQLILHIAEIDKENQYVLYLRTKPEAWFSSLPANFTVKVIPFPLFWTQIRISLEMILHPVDCLFIPASALPLVHPKNSVVTIHDLGWLFYPETFTFFMRWFLRVSTWWAVHSAHTVITVSESTKTDLLSHYPHMDKNKIQVVHHGYHYESVVKVAEGEAGILTQIPERYFLFLSTLQPRKNLHRLVKALAELKDQEPHLREKLVVVGRRGWKYESDVELLEQHSGLVIYLDYVSDRDRDYLLGHAVALVMPSLYEGFGMQILEGFAAGVPVLTSNVSSMPEVAGKAALYFDPLDVNSIKQALAKIIDNEALREDLISKGKERLKEFAWERCAHGTVKAFSRVN